MSILGQKINFSSNTWGMWGGEVEAWGMLGFPLHVYLIINIIIIIKCN